MLGGLASVEVEVPSRLVTSTGQLLSRNITKPDAVRIEDPAAAQSAKRDTQVMF